jgi:hypothetical protein
LKYYICHKLNNYKSETYDEDEDKYKVRNGDATEDKRTAISSEKSSQGISTVDSVN